MAATPDTVKTLPLMTTAQVGEVLAAMKVLYDFEAEDKLGRLEVHKLSSEHPARMSNWAFSVSSIYPELSKALFILFKRAPDFVGEHLRLRELLTRIEVLAINQNKKLEENKNVIERACDVTGPVTLENHTLHEELLKKDEKILQQTQEYDTLNTEFLELRAKHDALVTENLRLESKLAEYEKQFEK